MVLGSCRSFLLLVTTVQLHKLLFTVLCLQLDIGESTSKLVN